jgi:hypothetical protein
MIGQGVPAGKTFARLVNSGSVEEMTMIAAGPEQRNPPNSAMFFSPAPT